MNGACEPESFRAQPGGDSCACCIVADRHEYPRFSLFGHREDAFGGACDFVAEKGFAVQGPIVVEQVRDGRYRIAHLLADNRTLHGKPFFGYKVAGATESILAMPEKRKPWVLVSIGDNAARARIAAWLRAKGFRL